MADKRKKRKAKRHSHGPAAPSTASSTEHSGGLLQGMRSGFRRAAGVEEGPPREESRLSKIIWGVVFVVILAFAASRWLGLWDEDESGGEEEPATAAQEERTPAKTPSEPEPVRRTPVKTTHEAPPPEPVAPSN